MSIGTNVLMAINVRSERYYGCTHFCSRPVNDSQRYYYAGFIKVGG